MVPVNARLPATTTAEHPFRLNTGRVRDQWHTMTRTGMSSRLSQHLGEPYLQISPTDAACRGLSPATLACVTSPQGQAILRVMISDDVAPGHPFAPMHWTAKTAPTGRIDALVASVTDPVSGQPASKSTPVAIRPFAAAWYGFAVSRQDLLPASEYWAKAPVAGGVQVELAGATVPADWAAWAASLFGGAPSLALSDPARGLHRFAFTENGRLQGAVFLSPEPVLVARSHLAGLLGHAERGALAGRPGAAQADPGPTICACLNVGLNTILAAIANGTAPSVQALGEALGAGTNCGSCRPELAALINRRSVTAQGIPTSAIVRKALAT